MSSWWTNLERLLGSRPSWPVSASTWRRSTCSRSTAAPSSTSCCCALPPGVEPGEVEDALRLGGALEVLSSKVDGPSGDATVRAIELVGSVLGAPGDADVMWVAPAVVGPQRLAVVSRRLDVRFSATEAARLRGFATVLEVLAGVPG